VIARLRRRAVQQDGFSLIELLVALALGSIVLTAVMTVFINGLTGSAKVTDRVEAAQRARNTSDRINTLLQAQVCSDGAAPITEATTTSVTFTANTGDVAAIPTRYRVRWDSATNRIYEDRWVPTVAADGSYVWPPGITSTRVIGTDMTPENDVLFTYNAFNAGTGGIAEPELPQPISTATMQTIVSVSTSLVAQPERTKVADARKTVIETQAITGSADAANPNRGPKC
jgi:prepilin-type N-terminal cleavage/methylation domain-containing protein